MGSIHLDNWHSRTNSLKSHQAAGGKMQGEWLEQFLVMPFSQLNNDVILEIFLQFVAIDWDGPFTLMLVCTKWSNLVLSQPRVWTWIMVDETQAEWRDRMEVGAHLSRNLPLQIVLRVPFETQVSLSHITRRCTSLFVDSKHLDDYYSSERSRSWTRTITSYEQFTGYSGELTQSNDSLLSFLKGVRIDRLQIRNEDREYTSFAYSAWHVYERLNQRASLQEVITSGDALIITALVFKHSESAPLPRIQFLVTDLWGVLPLLSSLCYLELADSYIRVPKDTVLAHIELRSLQTLKIDSPMMGSVFLSLEDDVWLGLLSLLDVITAPNLEDLSLHSPLHRIVAALIKCHGRFRPVRLNISISVFDETLDQGQLDGQAIWHGLRRCTVHIPEQNKARPHTDFEVVGALRLLFNLIPMDCPVQLHGNSILEPILQSDLLMDVELHVLTKGDPEQVDEYLRNPRKIRSLSITGMPVHPWKRVPWIASVEELWVGVGSTLYYPYEVSLPMRVLDCAPFTQFLRLDYSGSRRASGGFSNLRDIECDCTLAVWMVGMNEAPPLRSLTLSRSFGSHNSFSQALEVVEKASDRLLSLETLGIRGNPEWEYLLPFVAKFNRSRGRGISAVKLFGLPHPAILHHLGRAFEGEADESQILLDLFSNHRSQIDRRYPNGCLSCARYGWSCHRGDLCSRWRSVDRWRSGDMVTITAYMPIIKYLGGWGPDGQGWEDDLNVSETRMGAEYEGAGDTSEISVE